MVKTHLVTGGSGFLGNLIVQKLINDNQNVIVLDIWKSPNLNKKVKFILGSVLDENILKIAMKGVDIVHHNAALVPLTKSGKEFWNINVNGSELVAKIALTNNIESFIHMSSSALYGNPICPINNNTLLKPIEIYGESKLEGEKRVKKILNNSNVKLVIIRPRTILGEGRLGIFQILFEWISQNKNVYTIGNGKKLFQFIHAHDLMDFYMIILEKNLSGSFNLGTPEFGELKSDLEYLINAVNSKSKVKSLPEKFTILSLKFLDLIKLSPLAPWHYLTYHKEFYFETKSLLKLGWEPKYGNKEMLLESYNWFLENKENLKVNEMGSPHRRRVKEMVLKILKWIS